MAESGRIARDVLRDLAAASDNDFCLASMALTISAQERSLGSEVVSYLQHVDALAGELESCSGSDVESRVKALAEVLGRRYAYRCDDRDDDDISNTSLMWVVDNRRGGPEALGLLGLVAARRAGWAAEMLSFPIHVLLRIEDCDGQRIIVDPVANWRVVDPQDLRALLKNLAGLSAELLPSYYAELSNRAILVRLQDTAKIRLLRCGCMARALAVVETTLLFAPDQVALWREAGMMNVRLGHLPAAVVALEQFLIRTENGQAKRRTQELVQELRTRIEQGGL